MAWLSGYSRDEINWGPSIDPDKCVGCGICLSCGKKVFGWKDGKAVVKDRNNCVPACQTCGNLCLGEAISFPPISELRKTYKEKGIWSKVRKDMNEKGVFEEK